MSRVTRIERPTGAGRTLADCPLPNANCPLRRIALPRHQETRPAVGRFFKKSTRFFVRIRGNLTLEGCPSVVRAIH